MTLRPLAVTFACAALGAALTGCAAATTTRVPAPATAPATTSHIDPGGTTQPIGELAEMPAAQKKAQLNSAFVTEWPVVAGKVVSSATPSAEELDFTLAVPFSAQAVEEWYRKAMNGRAFVLTRSERDAGGIATLTFLRAGVTYVVRIEPDGRSASRVRTIITAGR